MRRDLGRLADRVFDVAIVGGGIYGVSIAREAALRGLAVALVEKGDFGGATSANSHKIVHGGLRYLQSADFRRMRESIRERSAWLRIAPHLVRPQPFLMPTYGHGMRGREALAAALAVNDVLSADRNRGLGADRRIPAGRVVSREECLALAPGIDPTGLTGGAVWHDGLMESSERLLLAVLISAVEAGAEAANYVAATGIERDGAGRIAALRVRDARAGGELDVRTACVVNAGGPWSVGGSLAGAPRASREIRLAKAMNLVVRPVVRGHGIGVARRFADASGRMRGDRRLFFLVPWRDVTLAGTTYLATGESADGFAVVESEIETFLAEVNAAYPPARLAPTDVRLVHAGLVPVVGERQDAADVDLATRHEIRDHAQDGYPGVVTVAGVKYTTARGVAETVVDLLAASLGRPIAASTTAETPVYGGALDGVEAHLAREAALRPEVDRSVLARLVSHHGDRAGALLEAFRDEPASFHPIAAGAAATRAEILHAVRSEMALSLRDVVMRRTDLGTAGHPGDEALAAAAVVMAAELGWSPERTEAEIAETRRAFP